MPESACLEAVLHLYGRVVGLQLRIEKTPQATDSIRQRARAITAPLKGLEQKLKGRSNPAQLDSVQGRLLTVRRKLHELLRDQLNPSADLDTKRP